MNKLKYAAFLVTLSMSAALAVGTDAGSVITNVASASYNDPSDPTGTPLTSTSNTVKTEVAPQPGISITPNDDSPSAPTRGFNAVGLQEVSVEYTLANPGNFANTYGLRPLETLNTTTVASPTYKFYEESTTTAGTADLTKEIDNSTKLLSVPAGGVKKFYMVYTIPAGAVDGKKLVVEPVGEAKTTSFTAPVTTQNPTPTAFTGIVKPTDGQRSGTPVLTDGSGTTPNDLLADGTTETSTTAVLDNFHQITIQAAASLAITKTLKNIFKPDANTPANPSTTTVTSAKIGDFLEYEISVTNSSLSRSADNVSITDAVPGGTTLSSASFTTGTGTFSNTATTIVAVPAGSSVAANTTVKVKVVVKIISLEDRDENGAPDPVSNQASVAFTDQGKPSTDPKTTTTSDSDPKTDGNQPVKTDVRDNLLGPVGAPKKDDTPNSGTPSSTADSSTQGPISTSSTVKTPVIFPNTVKNSGSSTDTFDLTAPSPTGLPSGASVLFVPASADTDGTPGLSLAELKAYLDPSILPGSTGTGTGVTKTTVLNPGDSQTFFTVVLLPVSAPTSSTPIVVTVLATSEANLDVKDATTDTVSSTNLPATLVGNNDNNKTPTGTPPSVIDNDGTPDLPKLVNTVVPSQANPTTPSYFPIDLVNKGLNADTVVPSGSVVIPTLTDPNPAPTPIKYYEAKPDGSPDLTKPIPNTGISVPPGTEITIVGVVDVPKDAKPTTGAAILPLNQTFTSTQNGAIDFKPDVNTDSLTKGDGLKIGANDSFSFSPNFVNGDTDTTNNSGVVTATGSKVYKHTLTNTGTSTITGVALTYLADPATHVAGATDASDIGNQANFKIEYSLDGTTFTTTLPNLSATTIAANGGTKDIYVRVTNLSPSNLGEQNDIALSALPTFSSGNPATAKQVEDVTKVSNNPDGTTTPGNNPANFAFLPVKTVDKATAKPGDTLVYNINGINNRKDAATLTNTIICDTLPTNTKFVSVLGSSTSGTVLYYSGTKASVVFADLSATVPTTLNDGEKVCVGIASLPTTNFLKMTLTVTVK